jgi:hypothetical protein
MLGEFLEGQRHHFRRNRWQNQPERLPIGRANEAVQIEPFVPRVDPEDGCLVWPDPDAPDDRLESQSMFVKGPYLNFGSWMLRLDCLDTTC